MNTEIKSRNDSALPRSEVQAIVTFDGTTPSRQELIKDLSSKLKSKAELVVIKNIYTAYGDKEASIIAYVYDNEDALKSIEYKTMVEKNILKKAEKPESSEQNNEKSAEETETKEEASKAESSESNADSQNSEKGE